MLTLILYCIAVVSSDMNDSRPIGLEPPNFSGVWSFDPAESDLQIDVPDAIEFSIEHNESEFKLTRRLTFGEQSHQFELELVIGADEIRVEHGEAIIHPKIVWDGDRLRFVTKIVRNDIEAINEVIYHLENDGTILVAVETFRSDELNYDNRWVFEKEGKENPDCVWIETCDVIENTNLSRRAKPVD